MGLVHKTITSILPGDFFFLAGLMKQVVILGKSTWKKPVGGWGAVGSTARGSGVDRGEAQACGRLIPGGAWALPRPPACHSSGRHSPGRPVTWCSASSWALIPLRCLGAALSGVTLYTTKLEGQGDKTKQEESGGGA